MEVDLILADIITVCLEMNPKRVVVYGGNYKAPKDSDLYIVIKTRKSTPIGSKNVFNESTYEENQWLSSFVNLEIELTSKNRQAYERKEEIPMALKSVYSIQQQERYGFKLFRTRDIIDLTFIEGASSLYRFMIPVVATSLKNKNTSVEYFDKLRQEEIKIEK